MATVFDGAIGRLRIGAPRLFVDNQARFRSGHMTHAMAEYRPGKIIDFNSNCSPVRVGGHAAFGWVEYRFSDDWGETWSEPRDLPLSRKLFFDGVYTISIERAVVTHGVITLFVLRNTQYAPICCQPWDTPQIIRSFDGGESWTEPYEMSPWKGRVYDAVTRDGVIYAMEFCNDNFVGKTEEHLYRLYRSCDDGASFREVGVIDLEHLGHAYGALQFLADGTLAAYSNCISDGRNLSVSVSGNLGATWRKLPEIRLAEGMRNVQIGRLGGGFVMHGRAWHPGDSTGAGFVVYTSRDGLEWDDGIMLEKRKLLCYYSNNMTMKLPDGRERMLVQYSDRYDEAAPRVNVMHLFMELE